ncbi:MAG TPA: LysE family translocator [Pseudomonas sp.]|nr:LysE family translocator [Pseudomonas sp.]
MQELTAVVGIATALLIGAASPGPSFVMVARLAIASSRALGICAALGMGVGGLLFALAALLGLQGVLLAVPSLYAVLKVAGGLYLAYLGVRIWRGASQPLASAPEATAFDDKAALRAFGLGLTTQLSNPKTAIVYASVFAAFLPATTSWSFNASLVSLVFLVEAGWYAAVALALSSKRPREGYLRYKAWIDRAAGGVMIALGMKLAGSTNHA